MNEKEFIKPCLLKTFLGGLKNQGNGLLLIKKWFRIGNYKLPSCTTIKYTFEKILFRKSSLFKKLSNIYLMIVDERSNDLWHGYPMLFTNLTTTLNLTIFEKKFI